MTMKTEPYTSMGCSKSSSQREVHSDTGLPPQTRKLANNLTYHLKELETEEQNLKSEKEGNNKDQRRNKVESKALFTIAKIQKQHKCPLTYECIKKMCYVYTMEHYAAIKKNKIMPLAATWMDLEIITLSEVTQKDKYHMISLICGI